MWHIVMQEESVGFGEKQPVKCKHVKCFPNTNVKTGQVTFGILKFPCLKVIMENDHGAQIFLTWTNSTGDTLAMPSPGRFSIKWPHKMVYQTIKGRNGREYEDTLSPKVSKEVVKPLMFENHQRFFEEVTRRFGQVLATEIAGLFAERLVELITKAEEAKKKKAKKAA
jgi:hypothetical protein